MQTVEKAQVSSASQGNFLLKSLLSLFSCDSSDDFVVSLFDSLFSRPWTFQYSLRFCSASKFCVDGGEGPWFQWRIGVFYYLPKLQARDALQQLSDTLRVCPAPGISI